MWTGGRSDEEGAWEIERLWKEVSSQLDLLSNLHFKPKRVERDQDGRRQAGHQYEDARPVGVGGERGWRHRRSTGLARGQGGWGGCEEGWSEC